MKMKYIILFEILVLTKLNSGKECALVSTDGSFELDLQDSLIPQEIGTFKKDFAIGNVLPGRFKVYNITLKGITSTNGYCDSAYFQMIFDEKEQELSFNLTEEFSTFDDDVIDQNKVEGCDFYLNFKADSDCKLTNSQIDLKYNIKDVNTHQPVFAQPMYILNITFPIAGEMSLIKLSNDVQEISAIDKDFSTETLGFEIMDENAALLFDVRPLRGSKHVFPVDIVSKRLLYLQESITFALRATDDGTDPGPKSGTTEITISLNPASIPPTPQFEYNFFQGKVDIKSADVNQVINDKPIKLQGTYTNPKFDCSGDGVIMNYVECDQQSDEVNVKIIKVPDEDLWSQAQVFVLLISATITNEVNQISTNAIPFILTLENGPSSCPEKDPDYIIILGLVVIILGIIALGITIIILCIVAFILLAALAYVYFKYVKGRKTGENAPLLDLILNNKESDGKRNAVDSETDKDKKDL